MLPREAGNKVDNGQMKKPTPVDDNIWLSHAPTQQLAY